MEPQSQEIVASGSMAEVPNDPGYDNHCQRPSDFIDFIMRRESMGKR